MPVPAVPGDTTVNQQESVSHYTSSGRCPRCERWPGWEVSCAGVSGVVHGVSGVVSSAGFYLVSYDGSY